MRIMRRLLPLIAFALAACGREKVVETFPKGDKKLVRTYGWFGGEKPENLKREQAFYFNGHKERDAHYRGGALDGDFADFWHNGQKRSQGKYVAGKKQGEWSFFYNQYTPSSRGVFKDDEKQGRWNAFWENGELKTQADFQGGREIGVRREWNAKGELTLESSCFETNDTGRYVSYHANKTPREDYRCRQGRPVGEYFRKDPDGTVVERGAFDSLGRKQGAWETFHEDGSKASLKHYAAGLQEDSALAWYMHDSAGHPGGVKERGFFKADSGELLSYDSLGHLVERAHLVKGKPEGEVRSFYPDGKPRAMTVYKHGLPAETRKWHPNGKPWTGGLFVNGRKTGEWKQFDERGRPLEIAHYVEGELHGDRLFYDSLGHLARTQRYEHGYPAEGKLPGTLLKQGVPKDSAAPR